MASAICDGVPGCSPSGSAIASGGVACPTTAEPAAVSLGGGGVDKRGGLTAGERTERRDNGPGEPRGGREFPPAGTAGELSRAAGTGWGPGGEKGASREEVQRSSGGGERDDEIDEDRAAPDPDAEETGEGEAAGSGARGELWRAVQASDTVAPWLSQLTRVERAPGPGCRGDVGAAARGERKCGDTPESGGASQAAAAVAAMCWECVWPTEACGVWGRGAATEQPPDVGTGWGDASSDGAK